MNILTLCLSPDLGGLELYAYRSALKLSETNGVIFVARPRGRLAEKLEDLPMEAHYTSPVFYHFPLACAYRLAGLIDKRKIDAVHIHWGKDLALAALAKKISKKKPVLVYTRQMDVTRSKKDFYHQLLYNQVDILITITNLLAEKFKRYLGEAHSKKIKPLYYGVDEPSHFLSQEEIRQQRNHIGFGDSDFIAGCFGRLEHGKGQYLMIEALRLAMDSGKTLKALIVGHEMNPGYREQLKQAASEYSLADGVIFEDFVPEPQMLMQICDCIVLATHEETFGLVLPEAMRAGIAVIGSNAGGVPEIIDHDETGLLFESRNALDLKTQLARLQSSPELKQRLAASGKAKADKTFNNKLHFDKLLSIMQDAVSANEH